MSECLVSIIPISYATEDVIANPPVDCLSLSFMILEKKGLSDVEIAFLEGLMLKQRLDPSSHPTTVLLQAHRPLQELCTLAQRMLSAEGGAATTSWACMYLCHPRSEQGGVGIKEGGGGERKNRRGVEER